MQNYCIWKIAGDGLTKTVVRALPFGNQCLGGRTQFFCSLLSGEWLITSLMFFLQSSNPEVRVPLHSAEHYYIVTKAIEGIHTMSPTVRDPDGGIYVREWSGGIMAGGFEPVAKPCFHQGVPPKFEFQLLPEDWDHFGELM